jgi:hypothetical protein
MSSNTLLQSVGNAFSNAITFIAANPAASAGVGLAVAGAGYLYNKWSKNRKTAPAPAPIIVE